MGMMRMHSMFPSMGTERKPRLATEEVVTLDTVKARAKRRAMQLVGIEDAIISMDPGEVSVTAMPSRMGYDDTIIEAEIPTEYGVDDSWIHLDENGGAPGVSDYLSEGMSGFGAETTVRDVVVGGATPPQAATPVGMVPGKRGGGLPKWVIPVAIGGAVLVGALMLLKKKK